MICKEDSSLYIEKKRKFFIDFFMSVACDIYPGTAWSVLNPSDALKSMSLVATIQSTQIFGPVFATLSSNHFRYSNGDACNFAPVIVD